MAGTAGSITVDLLMKTGSFETDTKRAGNSMDDLSKKAKVVGAALAVAFVAAGTAMAVMVKKSIDNMDAMSKLAASTGIAIESLTALGYAGDLAGVNVETLGANMVKLTKNMSDAAKGTGEAKDSFEAMGISVTDANGKLKSADDMLLEIADSFSKYKDGAEKTALAVGIFGRSGAAMVPMLNAGSKGLSEASEEAKRFGLVISQEAARAAEDFNDNLSRLQKVQEGWVNQITASILPQLGSFAGLLVDAATNTDDLKSSVDTLTSDSGFPSWLDTIGLGLARLVDVAVAAGKAISAVSGSFSVVAADIALFDAKMKGEDTNWITKSMQDKGYSGFDADKNIAALKAVTNKRNKILEDANQQWSDLWNVPLNTFEQGWIKAGQKAAFDKAFVGPKQGDVRALAPNIVTTTGSKGKSKGTKATKQTRSYIATDLDEMLIRMGEATEWLDSYEVKAEKTFDKTGEFALEAARNIQQSLGDGLYDILSGNFDDIGSKFADTLTRMVADAASKNLAGALFGDFDSQTGGGKIGGIFGKIIGSIWPSTSALSGVTASPSLDLGATFGSGGFTGHGGKFDPAGIVHKGEYVLSQDATRRIGRGTLDRMNDGYASGGLVGGAGPAGGVSVNITNQGQPVSASQPKVSMDSMGRMVIDIMIRDAQKNGPYIRQLQGAM